MRAGRGITVLFKATLLTDLNLIYLCRLSYRVVPMVQMMWHISLLHLKILFVCIHYFAIVVNSQSLFLMIRGDTSSLFGSRSQQLASDYINCQFSSLFTGLIMGIVNRTMEHPRFLFFLNGPFYTDYVVLCLSCLNYPEAIAHRSK